MGLPITEARARELAETIAQNVDTETVDALIELLLGIAPAYADIRDFPEADLANFRVDLECRKIAASFALATFFETSDIFLEAFRRYTEQYMPKQTQETMEDVFGFEGDIARKLIGKHAPDREQTSTPKGKRANRQRRSK
jgi:hypothetical protein